MTPTEAPSKPLLKLKRPIWWYAVGGLITLASIVILARLVYKNLDTLMHIRENLQILPLLLTIPLFFFGEVAGSYAYGKIMDGIAGKLPMREHFKIFMITFAGRRLPGSLWYVVGRIAWYERLGVAKLTTTFGSVLETVLILWSGLIMSCLFLPLLPNSTQRQIPLLIVGIVISALSMHPAFLRFLLKKLGQGEQARSVNILQVLSWLLYYFPIWCIGGALLFFSIKAIYPVPWSLLPICIGVWSFTGVLGMLILVLPTGLGLVEASVSLMLATQISSSIAVTGALLMRVVMTFLEFLLAGIVFNLFGLPVKPPDPTPLEPPAQE